MNGVLRLCILLVVTERRSFEGAQAYRTKRSRNPKPASFIDASKATDSELRQNDVASLLRSRQSETLSGRQDSSASSVRDARSDSTSSQAVFLPVLTFLVGLLGGSLMGATAMKHHIDSQLPELEPVGPVKTIKRGSVLYPVQDRKSIRASVLKKPPKQRHSKRHTTCGFHMKGMQQLQPTQPGAATLGVPGGLMVPQTSCMRVALTSHADEPEAPDLQQFEEAVESTNLDKVVDLLASNEPINPPEEKMHDWVENPKTVGTLAGTQIAIVASNCPKDEASAKLKIHEAGAIPMLVNFMRLNESDDRVQTAVVALSFLTLDCPQNTHEAYEEGAMELLLQHLDSPTPGMRASAATTLRNICMDSPQRIATFVQMGGLKGLVNQLFTSPDATSNNADVQLESVLNLQDILEGPSGDMHAEYAQIAVSFGVLPRLQVLQMSTEDNELKEAAEDLTASIEAVTEP